MKSQTVITLAAALLLAGAGHASASLFGSPPQASDSLSLSSQQQQTAWNDLSNEATSSSPSDFKPATTSAIPSTVSVREIPSKTAGDVPVLQPYDFAKVGGKLLIINPHDMMIAEVITG